MNTETEHAFELIGQGNFQRLATAVLSASEPTYRALLETGGNAQGQTIRSAADAFCRVPGVHPAHFISAEHTITDLRGLRRKWLHEPPTGSASDEGDLIKAARLAQERKQDFPGSRTTVVLTSNRRVNLDLEREVQLCARRLDVDVDIWDQSRLVRFLDNNGDGHWLRHRFLGIAAQRLSPALLRDLCERSLNAYADFFRFSSNLETETVEREVEDVMRRSDEAGHTLRCLVGSAGYGKSTSLWRVLRDRLGSGGYALWLSREHWNHTTLAGALEAQLRELYPSLLPGEGERALEIASVHHPLWVGVDDINALSSSGEMMSRVRVWACPPATSDQTNVSSSAPTRSSSIIWAPLWPQVWAASGFEGRTPAWIRKVKIGPLTSDEAGRLLIQAGRALPPEQIESIALSLGHDPFSLGLLLEQAVVEPSVPLDVLSVNITERYIEGRCHDAEATDSSFLSADFRHALRQLAWEMLRQRRLRPAWCEINTWFPGESAALVLPPLRILTKRGALCRLGAGDQWQFRHDRLQNVLCAEALVSVLASPGCGVEEALSSSESVLEEPYFAEIIGDALCRLPQAAWNALEPRLLSFLKAHNPLALAVALRQLDATCSAPNAASSTDQQRLLVLCAALKQWAQEHPEGEHQ